MVSVAVSKLGCTELFFIKPVVNADSKYYREVLLMKQMLPVTCRIADNMCRIADNTFVFQQDSTLHS